MEEEKKSRWVAGMLRGNGICGRDEERMAADAPRNSKQPKTDHLPVLAVERERR